MVSIRQEEVKGSEDTEDTLIMWQFLLNGQIIKISQYFRQRTKKNVTKNATNKETRVRGRQNETKEN